MSGPLRYISEPEYAVLLEAPKPPRSSKRITALIASLILLLFIAVLHALVFPPKNYPEDTVVNIGNGETLSNVASHLKEQGAIKSSFVFKVFVTVFGGSKGLRAGDYYLETPQNSIVLGWRFSHSEYSLKNVRVTIPEGTNSREIALIISREKKFAHFNPSEFITISAPYEGYLFPDTYLFLPNITAEDVLESLLDTYKIRIETLATEIKAFGRPIQDVIKMASIVEEEARTDETRRTIAGILWKRLDGGMPLQVDAAFQFVNGKGDSSLLTLDDLKIDSPYNTYVYKGLPPTPISNPGLASIKATVTPIKTKYYFYLSDTGGNMHYAETHDGHLINKEKYIPW